MKTGSAARVSVHRARAGAMGQAMPLPGRLSVLWGGALFGLCATFGATSGAAAQPAADTIPWAVYYGASAPAAAFAPFNLVILDSNYPQPCATLREQGKRVLAYISLGEAGSQRPYFEALRADGLLLAENPNWPGSFSIDVRDRRWRQRVLDNLIPAILAHSFDGLFIDTLDTPIELERAEPVKYAGMRTASAELVEAIRNRFPGIVLMVNRAYPILPRLGAYIDMVLGEAVFTRFDAATGRYRLEDPALYRWQVEALTGFRNEFPRVRVMTLDYWDPGDPEGVARIYREQRANGFSPYVGTVTLNRVVYEP